MCDNDPVEDQELHDKVVAAHQTAMKDALGMVRLKLQSEDDLAAEAVQRTNPYLTAVLLADLCASLMTEGHSDPIAVIDRQRAGLEGDHR
ncbi:MAG: hypothetical protein Q4F53_01340 [Nesterenkonia sp.]|nr:hypothetical protein [Nesterenkonia sp.]